MCPSNDTTPHSRMIRRKNSLDTVTAVWVLCNYTSTTCVCVCVVCVDGLWKLEEKKTELQTGTCQIIMMTISMCFAAHYTLEPLDFTIDQSKNSEEDREIVHDE